MKTNFLISVLALAPAISLAAFDDEGTDYSNLVQRTFVWNEALEPIEQVNSILCFTKQFNAEEFSGLGPYIALADQSACFEQQQNGISGQSSGAANQTQLIKAVAEAERTDATSPLEVNVWLPEVAAGDGEQAIKFKAVIRSGVTDTDPFGDFTFNYDFFDNLTDSNPEGGGEVATISSLDDKIGFTLYESGSHGSGGTYKQCASIVMNADRSSGVALTGTQYGNNFGGGGKKFALAFDEDRVLVQSTRGSFDDLPYKSGDHDTDTRCLRSNEF